jgi:threonylcarbamoyladenosine tRNA methylthiotransferase MtaB
MEKIKTIAWHTLGCKLNFSETSSISRQFGEQGYQQVEFSEVADLYVINSCTVTKNAEKRCRALINKALRTNPDAHVAVIGCFSQISPDTLRTIPGVDIVLGNADKFNLFEHIKSLELRAAEGPFSEIATSEPESFVPSWSQDDRTRSFFKIQDGCDYFCAYCTIPLARGRSRSDTIEGTLKTASEIAKTNLKEIVLTGVNIGDFGKKHGESFHDLLQGLVKVEGIERIRISSIEPDLLTDDIISMVAREPKLMPHFHIPLQSGSDTILKAMGRRYDTGIFTSRVKKIRSLMPGACIAVDLIVGFPGETPELFNETVELIENLDISYVHVFTYSERENTRAVKIESRVEKHEREGRSKLMHRLSEKKVKAFYKNNYGSRQLVLWEKDNQNGIMTGFTENYIKVKTAYNPELSNTIQQVALNNSDPDGIYRV